MWRIGIAFLIGHCCLHSLSALPPLWPAAGSLALCALAAIFLRTYFVLAVVLGFGWAWSHAQVRLDQDLPADLEGRDLIVTGRIASMLDMRDVDPQFELKLDSASELEVPSKIRLAWYDSEVWPNVGERWQFVVRLKRRNGFANPGGFDYEGYLFRNGIGATGYIREDDRNVRLGNAGMSHIVLRTRAWIGRRIAAAAGDTSMLGILQGLAVGDTQAMTAEQWRVFSATGTSHLMAISGLHITMIASLAALAGGAIVRIRPAQRLGVTAIHGQALAGCTAALAYSLLAGMSVPTQRTLIMLVIFFGVRWRRRELSVGNALGLALLSVLIVDPFAPLTVGAWLSFGAVAVILAATVGRIGREGTLVSFARVQWIITVGLLPVLIVSFGSQSLVSPFANAIAVPAFTLLIVPLVLFGSFLAAISVPAGSLVLKLTARLLEWSWPALQWLADLPWSTWYFAEMSVVYYLIAGVAAVLFVVPGPWPMRLTAVLLCVPVLFYRPDRPVKGEYEIAVLDVGQGLAIVVTTQDRVLVYDAGPAFRTGRDTGELVVTPFLRSRGVRRIDRLVISHGDLDHEGGMRSLLRDWQVDTLLAGPSVDVTDRPSERCTRGQRWSWDGVIFEVLHPRESSGGSDNDTSCVLRISGPGGSTLLTGDIESRGEEALLDDALGGVDIVVVAHHGSRSSSTEAFVAATSPRFAIASAGYRNRWGFPKTVVTERWQAAGAQVLSTIDSGAIEMEIKEQGEIVTREYRRPRRRYWTSR